MSMPPGYLQPVVESPGLFYPNPTMQPTSDGNFFPGDLIRYDANSWLVLEFDPTTPTLTFIPAQPPPGYGPRVEVLVTNAPPVAASGTLWRHAGGQRSRVRGAVRKSLASGAFSAVDSEVPFDIPVTYVTEIFDADGNSLGFLASESVTVPSNGDVWVHNILEPSKSIRWVFTDSALQALTEGNPGGTYTPEGQTLPRWVGGQSSGLIGVALNGSTYTLKDADAFGAMFGTREEPKVPILVFRGPPTLLLPGTFVTVIGSRTRLPQNVAWGGGEWVRWDIVGDEVEPPFAGLSEPVVELRDVEAVYDTLAQIEAAYSSLLDIARDYSLAGAAG